METKFESISSVPGDPIFDHLVCFLGGLIPIAHIKIISQVEFDIAKLEDENGKDVPQWGFCIFLTDSDFFEFQGNPQAICDTWDSEKEAEEQRRNLAIQVDNYYKKLLAEK